MLLCYRNILLDKVSCPIGISFRHTSSAADDYDACKEEFDVFELEEYTGPLTLAEVHFQPYNPTVIFES